MCESKDEGGRRCAAHTRPGYTAVIDRLTDPTSAAQARLDDTATEAVTRHASTRSGDTEVTDLANNLAATDPETSQWLHACHTQGRNRALAAHAAQQEIIHKSMQSALRRIGAMRGPKNPHPRGTREHRAWLNTHANQASQRFNTFKAMADADPNLTAPDGWIEHFKQTSTHSPALPTDRTTAYALWRAQSRGRDFAPADYDPTMCATVHTSPTNFRPGDVLEEPGFRNHAAVRAMNLWRLYKIRPEE